MGMQINTNLAANNAYRSLSNTQNDLSKSLEKLSSGLRINRASDDAAGMALSEGLKSQIGGLTVASRNAQDGIGMVQTAEGGLSQTHSILQRLRDLGVQAANDTNSENSRKAITTEAKELVAELTRISDATDFNGTKLLNGDRATNKVISFQVGASDDVSSQITVNLKDASVSKVAEALDFGNSSIKSATVTTPLTAAAATFKQGSTTVSVTLAGTTASAQAAELNLDEGFNQNFKASTEDGALVITSKSTAAGDVFVDQGGTVSTVNTPTSLGFDSAAEATASIAAIDTQIELVSSARSTLGSVQNRLESAVQTINVAKENLTASNSRIRDTDMAEEMVKFTRNNILSQAGTAMLAQANQSNQGVLQLLR
ncbi:flagellin [Pseudarthrobacter sp. NBSH8]|uniref:flagellin N-terminal helical domain-containing protein n=1 Tax=Pseudarthrobacter sp. NBSH8 TaxID=2596911 RepID=UPI001625D7A0|nr:flagellin [Pseudarthrobacter sp. NBSH8]QNE15636.1 flagellin [Pseudarthrobacter sp. NBSH8]